MALCFCCSLTCMVSSPWRSFKRLTMVYSLWALTLVFLSLVLSSRLFSMGLIRLASIAGVSGSLNTHHSTRSETSLMSLDWFWRHCGHIGSRTLKFNLLYFGVTQLQLLWTVATKLQQHKRNTRKEDFYF